MMEIEVKLRLETPEEARARLARAGATEAGPRQFEDNLLYDDAAGSLMARRVVLRLRSSGGRHLVTFKAEREDAGGQEQEHEQDQDQDQDQEEQYKIRVEHETTVADPDAFDRLLQGLGFRPRWRYQKYRQSFRLGAVHVELDETPLGTFIELEGEREGIDEAARHLGFDARAYVTKSYRELQEEATGSAEPGDLVFG